MTSEKSMFPIMGIGAFNIMFWIGFVVGHNIGLTCSLMLLNSLLFGGLGSYAVVRLERISKGNFRRYEKPKNRTENCFEPAYKEAISH